MRFAGMGMQLAVAIGLGVIAGMKVDELLDWKQPIGTAAFSLLGLAAGMYQILRLLR
jgi:F0F1-type ATP synthase assembly protein I